MMRWTTLETLITASHPSWYKVDAMTDLEDSTASAEGGSRSIVTWQDAEHLAARHMQELGFVDAHATGSGADGGIDVDSREAAAQVKFHAMPTGAPEIQKLRGAAYDRDHKIFYSAGGYTPAAQVFAERASVALFTIGPWSTILAANVAAETLVGKFSPEELDRRAAAEISVAADLASQRAELSELMESISRSFMQVGDEMLELPGSKQMAILGSLGPVEARFQATATAFLKEVKRADGGRLGVLGEVVSEAAAAVEAFSQLTGIEITSRSTVSRVNTESVNVTNGG